MDRGHRRARRHRIQEVYRESLQPWDENDTDATLVATVDGASTTSYTDTTTEAEVTYQYHVRAKNDAGHSGAWRWAMITTGASEE